MGTLREFVTGLPMKCSGAQMNRRDTGAPQAYSFVYMSDHSIDKTQQDKVDHSFSSQMSVPLMNRVAPENPPPHGFSCNHMDDSSMDLIPQNPAGPTMWKKHQKCTSFMYMQHEQLETLFSYTMFPDKESLKRTRFENQPTRVNNKGLSEPN